MALYIDLYNLYQGSPDTDEFRNRVYTATAAAAETLLGGTPTADQINWSAAVLSNPASEGRKAFIAVIMSNKTATIAQITSSDDATIQTAIDAIVPSLVIAFNAV